AINRAGFTAVPAAIFTLLGDVMLVHPRRELDPIIAADLKQSLRIVINPVELKLITGQVSKGADHIVRSCPGGIGAVATAQLEAQQTHSGEGFGMIVSTHIAKGARLGML